MKRAPAVRKTNSDKQERFELQERARDKVLMEEGRDAAIDKMIDHLIYRILLDSDRARKTAKAVWDGFVDDKDLESAWVIGMREFALSKTRFHRIVVLQVPR